MFGASGQGRARCSEKVHPPALLPLPANDAQSAQEQLLAGDTGHLVLLKLQQQLKMQYGSFLLLSGAQPLLEPGALCFSWGPSMHLSRPPLCSEQPLEASGEGVSLFKARKEWV